MAGHRQEWSGVWGQEPTVLGWPVEAQETQGRWRQGPYGHSVGYEMGRVKSKVKLPLTEPLLHYSVGPKAADQVVK